MPDLTGQILGRYQILALIGQGGMASVYRAYDSRLEREVAVKVIRVEEFGPAALGRVLKRFQLEVKTVARLTHPHIVSVIDYGEHEGMPYYAMQYVAGGTLKQKIGQPFRLQEAAQLLAPIADALAYAHRKNVVHRDVKPANILLAETGQPLLSDFGIVRLLENEGGTTLTGTGVGLGTPEYMAPEQGLAKEVDGRADIYSLGIVLYELLTGHRPYHSDTPMGVILQQISEPLPDPRQYVPGLPEAAVQVLRKALAKNPADRYQSMTEFKTALEELGAAAKPPGSPAAVAPPSNVMDPHRAAVLGTDETIDWRPPAEERPTPALAAQGSAPQQMPVDGKLITAPQEIPKLEKPGRKINRSWIWAAVGAGLVLLFAGAFLLAQKGDLLPQVLFASNPPNGDVKVTGTAQASVTTPALTPPASIPSNLALGYTLVSEKDGMVQVFVPAGQFLMGSLGNDSDARSDEKPQRRVTLDAFWIDRTEVTNAMYAKCVLNGACTPPPFEDSLTRDNYYGRQEYTDFPVIRVSWDQASQYCTWAGRRLPTEAEWEKAARGTDGQTFPWGDAEPSCDVSNYNNCSEDTTKTGSYAAGASPYGALDMAGNVWEWVSDWYSESYSSIQLDNPKGPDSGIYRVSRGGDWTSPRKDIRGASRLLNAPSSQGIDRGFRCALPAGTGADAGARPPAVELPSTPPLEPSPTPEPGATEVSEKDGMLQVYVPAGEFLMGSLDGDSYAESDEKPQHKVYLGAFWIDQTEVTNAMYAKCVEDGGCNPPGSASRTRISYYNIPEFDNYPVIYVTWNKAAAYCAWAGRRLPTEAEWEKAARGMDGRIYPWGNSDPTCDVSNFNNCTGDTIAAGSYPDGASPYGALDMAGSVWEWVADWHSESYYQNPAVNNPKGPADGTSRVLRGGSWVDAGALIRSSDRNKSNASSSTDTLGFRCAR